MMKLLFSLFILILLGLFSCKPDEVKTRQYNCSEFYTTCESDSIHDYEIVPGYVITYPDCYKIDTLLPYGYNIQPSVSRVSSSEDTCAKYDPYYYRTTTRPNYNRRLTLNYKQELIKTNITPLVELSEAYNEEIGNSIEPQFCTDYSCKDTLQTKDKINIYYFEQTSITEGDTYKCEYKYGMVVINDGDYYYTFQFGVSAPLLSDLKQILLSFRKK